MEKLKKDQRVRHSTQSAWGLGQLLEDENTAEIRIFFVNRGVVNLGGQARDMLEVVDGADAQSIYLDHMALPTGGTSKPMVTLLQAKQRFLEQFPGGYYGDMLVHQEREYKDSLASMARELLGLDILVPLIKTERFQQVCDNAVKLVTHPKNNLPSLFEKLAFKDGFKKLNNPRIFALSLFEYLHGTGALEPRFSHFANVLGRMEADKWPVITTFRFFLFPASDVYIKPINLQHAAEVSRFEINYKPQLNWLTYQSVTAFYQYLSDSTADLKPRDMIDVQSFIWCIDPESY